MPLTLPHAVRRSLLIQLISVYLLFVIVVLLTGFAVNAVVEQRLRDDVQAADQALAQEVGLQASLTLQGAENALVTLGALVGQDTTPRAVARDFRAFMAARADIDHVYWLDPLGALQVSSGLPASPADQSMVGAEFSPPSVVERARMATAPIFEVGIAEGTAIHAGVIIATPVRAPGGLLTGIAAVSLSLDELSVPLTQVVRVQQLQGRQLNISMLDDRGELIATPDHQRILQTVLDELPGARAALRGQPTTQLGTGTDGQTWLYSDVPVPGTGWAVVVQRPANEALAAVAQFHLWLMAAALIFALGGLVFWLMLLNRVIRPLHALALTHQTLPAGVAAPAAHAHALEARTDEIGNLAQALARLEGNVQTQLSELRTLLETSNAVVKSLDPQAVGRTIIREVRRLVDVQAASVLVPDEEDTLRVLASEGRAPSYQKALHIRPDELDLPSVKALRDGLPVQAIADGSAAYPSLSYAEGFRAVLAIPIISRHVGSVVLMVHRREPHPFTANEVDLLLTFANYATLAWEHAVLYERSDERLREVAHENERLYQQAVKEKQTLSAIMGSISDGLVLTSVDGTVLYANPGVTALTGLSVAWLEASHIDAIHATLRAAARHPDQYDRNRASAERGEMVFWLLEMVGRQQSLAIHLRLFDVYDDEHNVIGRGLLLRDVTQEHEADRFKTTLLAAVGHELRTPLTAIKGHASTLLQNDVTWTEQEQRLSLQTIRDEADHLAQFVTNLLDLTRLETGLLTLHRESWALADLITGAVGRLSERTPAPQIDISNNLPLLDVDATRVEVVLQNLIVNALTYGGGRVSVGAVQQGAMVLVRIADEGPGISQDDLPHVFDRFYRAPRDQQRHAGGTGLGLAICKSFIEAHGGAIWAESAPTGTTISFTLPVSSAPPPPDADALPPIVALREGHAV